MIYTIVLLALALSTNANIMETCANDAKEYCSKGNLLQRTACFWQNRDLLTEQCLETLRETTAFKCARDIDFYCAWESTSQVTQCLYALDYENLSEGCAEALEAGQEIEDATEEEIAYWYDYAYDWYTFDSWAEWGYEPMYCWVSFFFFLSLCACCCRRRRMRMRRNSPMVVVSSAPVAGSVQVPASVPMAYVYQPA